MVADRGPLPSVTSPRRFPPPWSTEDNGACFIVKDHSGQALAYVYYELEPGRRTAANLLTKDADPTLFDPFGFYRLAITVQA